MEIKIIIRIQEINMVKGIEKNDSETEKKIETLDTPDSISPEQLIDLRKKVELIQKEIEIKQDMLNSLESEIQSAERELVEKQQYFANLRREEVIYCFLFHYNIFRKMLLSILRKI